MSLGLPHFIRILCCIGAGLILDVSTKAHALEPDDIEFFENKIRPVLAQDCYECHRTGKKTNGGLALDYRQAILDGGDSGALIDLVSPEKSLLLKAIRHQIEDLEMPKKGPKLDDSVIADFEKWIRMGAPDPRDQPSSDEEIATDTEWASVLERRKSWWSFQLPHQSPVPAIGASGSELPVDRFIDATLAANDHIPMKRADKRTLIRRLSFALKGLPPKPGEIDAFLRDDDPQAYEKLVDDYLASPRFGERWARHWMDWIRYADSHGSEGDPMIPNAWRYRDYLIRALNADVPYDQLVREHLAGDLLPDPRINTELGLNESAIGPAQLRMVFHGFAPTDALDELVKFSDDQINLVSKAFMGLTVSCARCHNHKFDPISQTDFYSWYGIMTSGRPGMVRVDVPDKNEPDVRSRLTNLNGEIKEQLLTEWIRSVDGIADRFAMPNEDLKSRLENGEKDELLWPLAVMKNDPDKFRESWSELVQKIDHSTKEPAKNDVVARWDFSDPVDAGKWFHRGQSLDAPVKAGAIILAEEGDHVVSGVYPSGNYSHLQSTKDRGVLLSPKIALNGKYDLWLRVAGDGGAMARYSVQNYPRDGTVYPVERLNGGDWRWKKFPMAYWEGDGIHIELTTAADQPVLANTGATRSWFGLQEAVVLKSDAPFPPAETSGLLGLLVEKFEGVRPQDTEELVAAYRDVAAASLRSWQIGNSTDEQALFLNALLQRGLLSNDRNELASVRPLLAEYRKLENDLPVPLRAPGILETVGSDQPLFERGNHKKPGGLVARRFLDAIDSTPYQTELSGRLDLAEDLVRPDNPFASRVLVNRVWHHLFGRGLVATPDNFGRLGQKPTHPELLDYLAVQFVETGWSMKELIRSMVRSEAWQRSSDVSAASAAMDPENKLLAHFTVRRLEAEAVRDALLAVGGKLNENEMYGPPVMGDAARRSVYVRIKRNDLDPFLTLFDAPVPASAVGKRDVTNVPGQALAFLNGPVVTQAAEDLADRLIAGAAMNDRARVELMFVQALGRPPTEYESDRSIEFMADMNRRRAETGLLVRRLEEETESKQNQLSELDRKVTERVLDHRTNVKEVPASALPSPIAAWDFSVGMDDQIGGLPSEMFGKAKVKQSVLFLDGKSSYVGTSPLGVTLRAKTLEAWVQLDSLDQRGGGVMSLQSLDGSIFDAIVFGEQQPRKWLAGSDGFRRTTFFNGPDESDAEDGLVHVAITYSEDGMISAYQNGQPYGKTYQSNGPVEFKSGDSQILFGNRHGTPDESRLLKGSIARARLYDRALSAEELAASFRGDATFVSTIDRLAAMTPDEMAALKQLQGELEQAEKALKALQNEKGLPSGWADLAHAVFNLKEFVYIR